MQVRLSSIPGDRPSCPVNPHHAVDCHGSYARYANCNDEKKCAIDRFLCRACGRTISVLPGQMLPYRALSTALVQKHFDAQAHPDPAENPTVTQKEKGCLKRAWDRFGQRVAALATVLGQMMQIRSRNPRPCWLALRRWGNLPAILRQLAQPFNTSLLHDYLCLLPWRPPAG